LLSRAVLGPASDQQTHMLPGLVTGVGFIGGGAIIKANGRVHGTAAAASIWATAIIGDNSSSGRHLVTVNLSSARRASARATSPSPDLVLPRED
jgi:putative Mg2+ transporter-C (MgtC) family protein